MSKTDQVLHIEPGNELRFRGPFNEVVTADLKLTNPSDKKVCFKVKTTAPKRYCVRPNSGVLDSKNSVTVSVMLQPFEYDPNEKNKHKFMVQTMFAPGDKVDNLEQLWKEIPADQLMDSKLKCVFEMPTSTGETITQPAEVREEKVKPIKQEPAESRSESVPGRPQPPGRPTQPPSAPKTNPGPAADSERKPADDVRRLQQTIESLKQENSHLKEAELRLRKVAMSDTVSSTPPPSQRMDAPTAPMVNLPSYAYLIIAFILGIIISKLLL